jgi:N-acetyl-anhydromuramyl-L-alanine amidase AmpD
MGYNSLAWLQGASAMSGKPVSCDFLINRMGWVYQIGRPGAFCFHTGPARWGPLQDPDGTLNQQAVGIEFECAEHKGQRINDFQYIAGARLCNELMAYHGIQPEDIITHAMVAKPQGRKSDPIYFDLNVFGNELENPSPEGSRLRFPAVLP